MNWQTYSTAVPGKWVLAGEHTVLRGGAAVALPHPKFRLRIEFRPDDGNFRIEPDLATPVLHDLWKIAKEWLAIRGRVLDFPRGTLSISSTIPFGAGLGSSAALSVGIARWILSAHSLDQALERELARRLENHFHGKSSGMDVAVVSIGEPIRFSMAEGAVGLGISKLPNFVFLDSGLRASTRDCIERVDAFRFADPERGRELDDEMIRAAGETFSGLIAYNGAKDRNSDLEIAEAMDLIARGMNRAGDVFSTWRLVPDEIRPLFEKLKHEGARSPRLTGAGGGGYVVALAAH